MNIKMIFLVTFIPVVLSGCAIPGSELSLGGKNIVDNDADSNEKLNDLVNVYPLTPQSLARFQPSLPKAEVNTKLDAQVSHYEYKVGPGDILNVTVWDHPELTIPAGSYRSSAESGNSVHADGTIFYPYIGKVYVQNQTVRQIRLEITKKLSKYIESPQIDVSVAAFRSKKIYVTGEVSKPGQQPITNIPLTLLDAINDAGGLAADADWRHVTVTNNAKEETVSLYALMQRGDLTQNHLLEQGDIIHVPRNDSQKVFVMGEVNNPKSLKIDRAGMSLTEALSNVGGINELSADATGVFVIRGTKGKSKNVADVFQLNIKDATALALGAEFNLQPYDIVYVTAVPMSRWNRVVNLLTPTITQFNNLSEGTLRVRTWP